MYGSILQVECGYFSRNLYGNEIMCQNYGFILTIQIRKITSAHNHEFISQHFWLFSLRIDKLTIVEI